MTEVPFPNGGSTASTGIADLHPMALDPGASAVGYARSCAVSK